VDIREYEEIGRYPHNGYPTDMGTSMRRIFIQRVGYQLLPGPIYIPSHNKQDLPVPVKLIWLLHNETISTWYDFSIF